MKLNRIVQRDKPSPIHSSGFVQRSDVIGSTAVDPFSQRLQRDRSRQLIDGYRDAKVLRQHRDERYDQLSTSRRSIDPEAPAEGSGSEPSAQRPARSSRIDIVKPASSAAPSGATPPTTASQHSFREPPSRYRP